MNANTKATTATKVAYWVTTGLLALFILPGILFINSQMAKDGMQHLSLPHWFAMEVSIGQFIGGLILIIPMWMRIKEWAYVAVGIVYLSALIAHLSIDGFSKDAITAIVMFLVLLTSYITYHKIND